jgi:hypothetical protein
MPRKDQDEYRQYQKEQMRKRRAAQKGNLSNTEVTPDIEKLLLKTGGGDTSLVDRTPIPETTITRPPPDTKITEDSSPTDEIFLKNHPGGYWSRFPGQQGRQCFVSPEILCCYDLNFPVPWKRWYCGCQPKTCNYSKKGQQAVMSIA